MTGCPPEERGAIFQEATDYSEARRASGFYQGGEPLESTHTATTVRMKNGKALTTDGPFAETKEQLAGYTIVEAKDLDEVLAFAAAPPAGAGRPLDRGAADPGGPAQVASSRAPRGRGRGRFSA